MASTHKSLRSGTANKRPTTSIAEGQIALNTNATSPGLYFKDSTGAAIIKIGPVHVGTTAPNVAPAGSSGNSTGEAWLDTSLTPNGWKVWTGAAWVNATPAGSETVQGLLELATNAETQAGSDTTRAVTPAGLQSKVSDSTSTTSSTTIASSTAVKAAYDLANAALPKSGGTVTGNLEIGNTGSLTFEGATADAFETTIAVVDPTADRTITLPNVTGTVVTTGDTGSVTSTMILDGTILNADVNASAAIAGTKISPDFGSQNIATTGIFSHALGTAGSPTITFTGDTNTGIYSPAADTLAFVEGGVESARIDSSGRLLVNTSTSTNVVGSASLIQAESTTLVQHGASFLRHTTGDTPAAGAVLSLGRSRGSTVGSVTSVANNDTLGYLIFAGANGSDFSNAGAWITGQVDGAVSGGGANDMPGRLVFGTTADGASTPTERMRIGSDGWIYASTTSRTLYQDTLGNGLTWSSAELGIATMADSGLYINRTTADGDLIRFYQGGTQEGAISVSGTTVTYGGGHLARWSQLPNNEEPSQLLKGTVMSNLDEMCDWGSEDNEQLNKTKISDVEGDKNVAGVFVSTSFSEDGLLDFFVGMTGDMVIRIAEGVTVERGDLLMSAGDGTAKPQEDDIIRSKTIAKVTSTNVSCTYDDGSYCVPCVLMAC